MKKALMLAFIMLISATAFAFDLTYTDTTIRVPVSGSHEAVVSIASSFADSFVISPLDTKTWVTYDKNIVKVDANKEENFTVIISPTSSVQQGLHQISLNVQSQATKESKKVDLYAYVFKGEGTEIEKFFVSGNLEPDGNVNMKFSVRNIGDVKLQNIDVALTVSSPSERIYEASEVISLDPGDARTIERSFRLKENAAYGDYNVNIKITQIEKLLDETNDKFVIARKAIIRDQTDIKANLLKRTKTIVVKNVGNAPSDEITFTDEITSFDSNFFSGTAPSETQGSLYLWHVPPLQPAETYTIKYSLDYSPMFYFLLVISAFGWVYYTKLRIVRISKYILQKKHIREGEEFTVGVEVKNYSGSAVAELEVFDFVPAVFDYKDTEGPKPTRNKKESGIELKWEISNLAANEERILTYKVIPVVEITGMIRLPIASVVYASRNKEVENKSNIAFVGVEQEKEPVEHHLKKFFKKKE